MLVFAVAIADYKMSDLPPAGLFALATSEILTFVSWIWLAVLLVIRVSGGTGQSNEFRGCKLGLSLGVLALIAALFATDASEKVDAEFQSAETQTAKVIWYRSRLRMHPASAGVSLNQGRDEVDVKFYCGDPRLQKDDNVEVEIASSGIVRSKACLQTERIWLANLNKFWSLHLGALLGFAILLGTRSMNR